MNFGRVDGAERGSIVLVTTEPPFEARFVQTADVDGMMQKRVGGV